MSAVPTTNGKVAEEQLRALRDPEAEARVLSAMLQSPSAVEYTRKELGDEPAAFAVSKHQVIYVAALAVHDQAQHVDQTILCDELARRKELEEIGGREGVAELARLLTGTEHLSSYVGIVRDLAARRRVNAAGERLKRLTRERQLPLDELAVQIRSTLEAAEAHLSPAPVDLVDNAEDIDIAVLLQELVDVIRRYVVLSRAQAVAIALWVAHTHAFEAADATPYLAVTSAEKRSGKTRVLDICELLVAKPWRLVTPSEAVVYRKIHKETPTLLLDEVDTIFGPRAREQEGLRALLNAGHRRGTTVPRCIGESSKSLDTIDFAVFCPKAMAGIGALPDTVADRSIPVRLKRAVRTEQPSRFRKREVDAVCAPLREDLARWASARAESLAESRPDIPRSIHDRAAEGIEPLLAIADAAGGDWPSWSRDAMVELFAAQRADTSSAGTRVLADVRQVFERTSCDRISSADLVTALCEDKEAPWAEWGKGRGLTQKRLSDLLRTFDIHSKSTRLEDGSTPKGFTIDQFADAFARYLPTPTRDTEENAEGPQTTPNQAALLREVDQLIAEGILELPAEAA